MLLTREVDVGDMIAYNGMKLLKKIKIVQFQRENRIPLHVQTLVINVRILTAQLFKI